MSITEPGVYRVRDVDVDAAPDWRLVVVRPERGRAGLLRALGTALRFPDWYAANFDALADCLRDLPDRTVLVWHGWSTLLAEDHQAFHTALDVLAERAADAVAPDLVVLLPGPGPDLGDAPQVSEP
ncbi:hypothetical protein GCM10011519_09570 [Marmoricola endophyticus]|uniref:Barstar (barnase inhibitor) domain-containing protein n=1 Tax=Marmoricola endophyticus TaxID=2040280 RepID=A0A917BEN7_9ACTN|nr:barstar family protein [Marmoricola endophyticus]GGF38077.1 hypothetical protein GCM10011519_09570 [Marmoricola endophyticus]